MSVVERYIGEIKDLLMMIHDARDDLREQNTMQ